MTTPVSPPPADTRPDDAPAASSAPETPPVPPEGRGTTVFWLGILTIGVLMIAIVIVLQIREIGITNLRPTATFAPDTPGIIPIQPREVLDFTLPASTGGDISLSSIGADGQYSLIFFGYTHCPDFCPTTLGEFNRIYAALGEQAENVRFIFVSVDAERDTPEALNAYVTRFNPAFLGLSGDDVTLARIAPDYNLVFERHTEDGEDYLVDHSTPSYFIDPQRRLRTIYSYSADYTDIVENILSIMREDGQTNS